ncbi:MAG: extradiol ring-cleavage dioxygenase [Pseudonocardia sp. SCN 72-86]|nr:MAG: extradiol ring-cleavage dioxygenase [Pseudonocardia sp. SCN 72-86]
MAEFLGLGITHYPLLAGTDEHMAGLLRWTLTDPDIPDAAKDPASWPALMQKEWGDDGGVAAAGHHRAELRDGLARCRAALDDFGPDLVLVWGDDQYENFREEIVPPFCVLAYGDTEVEPFELMTNRGSPNAWGRPDHMTFTLRGDRDRARTFADGLIREGFDVAYSYVKRESSPFPHAIANTQLFLDYDHAGTEFPYPILPITVNCYGQHAIARRGGLARFAEIAAEEIDPVGPTPARCIDLGAAVVRALAPLNLRIALVASSSWSHAFLVDKLWHLRPDTAADERLHTALSHGDLDTWRAVTPDEIVDAGQHEMLNWFCLAGAMAELQRPLSWSNLVVTDVFNSNKCFAIYGES